MPYILSRPIVLNSEIMWMEGPVYEKENIYSIQEGKLPPVNYDLHKIKSHSVTHVEGSLHVLKDGKSVDQYFENSKYFYGACIVIKLAGNSYKLVNAEKGIYHWEVSKEELETTISKIKKDFQITKVLLTTEYYPTNNQGYHDPNYVLTLSEEAADYLISFPDFNMYGTSWKSSDFKPGSSERPIHKKLFSKAIVFELLDLKNVPEGEYFFVGFPVRLEAASESPVTPVLFTKSELLS